jgi:hypothetical protein
MFLCKTVVWKLYSVKFLGFVFVAYVDVENCKKVKGRHHHDSNAESPITDHNCSAANSLTLSFISHFQNIYTFVCLLHQN